MGQQSEATFSYGFILDKDQIVKLLFASRKHDDADRKTTKLRQTSLTEDELQEIEDFMTTWFEGEDTAPFRFRVYSHDHDGYPKGAKEMAFCYAGSNEDEEDEEDSHSYSTEMWGRENYGASFVGIPQPLTDPKFLEEAQRAIKQVQESPLFREAEIADIVPQWILCLSIG